MASEIFELMSTFPLLVFELNEKNVFTSATVTVPDGPLAVLSDAELEGDSAGELLQAASTSAPAPSSAATADMRVILNVPPEKGRPPTSLAKLSGCTAVRPLSRG